MPFPMLGSRSTIFCDPVQGSVGAELALGAQDGFVAFGDNPTLPLPLLQDLTRNHPPGSDDVHQVPLSLRNVEDFLYDRGIDICVTVRPDRMKRLWTDEEKRLICFQTAAPGVTVAPVARRYAVNANMVFK